jgi:hypothetical protein
MAASVACARLLELGTGRIDYIYVLVPTDEGVFQIARGGGYSYYEFWRDAGEGRLTDEEWRAMLAAGGPQRDPVRDGVPGRRDRRLPRHQVSLRVLDRSPLSA